jgi:hypothetical protein
VSPFNMRATALALCLGLLVVAGSGESLKQARSRVIHGRE